MNLVPLPIDDALPTIVEHLRNTGAVVLKAEPGAGKTTRVPPAMLDAGMAVLPDKSSGLIIVLQPRRVAARAAATRIAEERGTALGEEIGYQVRFEKRASRKTRILVCTEGVFLRKLQEDPFIETTAAVVFDEFHERSIDSDLALAMVRQIRNEIRPDLRLVVMSATLDSKPICDFLGGCPAVESPGRNYPVSIEFLRNPSSETVDRAAANGVSDMFARTEGNILVFLPGVGEIRQTEDLLLARGVDEDALLMQLYGDLPLDEQQKVLRPTGERKIILSTNVAETSLTINGVTTVVDSGLARVNRLDPRSGLNRLEVTRISRASADQRAGRAGRQSAGRCLRLWTEREQQMLSDFEKPEIARVELSQCLLQLFAWGENDVASFPWFEQPPRASVDQALALLEALDAIVDGRITAVGKVMASLPLQPRLARLLVEGARLHAPGRAALCAALLSEREPIRRGTFKGEHHSNSDVLDRIEAIEEFQRSGRRDSFVGEILSGAARQILRGADQLMGMAEDLEKNEGVADAISDNDADRISSGGPLNMKSRESDEALLRSLMIAFPDRVCKRREAKGRRAVMVGGRGVRLAEESAVMAGDLFVAVEMVDSGQPESLVRQASFVDRAWLPKSHVRTVIDVEYDSEREKIMALKRTKFCDLVLEESPVALPPDLDSGAALAKAIADQVRIENVLDDDAKQFLTRIRCLREWLPELDLPSFDNQMLRELLPEWCFGCTSVNEVRSRSFVHVINSRLSPQQMSEIEKEAPERVLLPNGRRNKIEYELGKPPVLAARIQDLFGMPETPRLARGRVPVLLHLLAPNYRVQQVTSDLAGFWKNTYATVRKELKGRYPKHAWPEKPEL